jgi:drug/metabolite transporter (DMT)-like permease
LALGGATLYGLVPVFAHGAFVEGIPAVESTLVRTVLMALVFCTMAKIFGQRLVIPSILSWSFLLQAIATLVISVSYLASVQFIPVGLAVIIFFTFPVLIVFSSVLVEGRKPDWFLMICVVLAFAGLALALGPSFTGLDWRGLALASAAALGAVVQSFSGRTLAGKVSPLVFGGLVHGSIAPFTLAIALVFGGGSLQLAGSSHVPLQGIGYLAGLSGAYIIAYFLHMKALSLAPASIVMPFFNLEPMVSTGLAALLFGERMSLAQYGGGVMVLVALVAVGFIKRQESSSHG